MAFLNFPTAALLLSLSVALTSAASDYATIAEPPASFSPVPAPAPAEGPAASDDTQVDFDVLNSYAIPVEEKATDTYYLKSKMTAAANKVQVFLANDVASRLNDPNVGNSEKECLLVCKEVYESAVDSMKTGMESVSSGDFMKANFDISAFTTDIDTCDECFDDFKDFDGWAKGVGGDCLDKLVKYSN